MRPYGSIDPLSRVPTPPDTISSILLAANTAQAMDYPSGAKMMEVTARSSDGTTKTPAPVYINFFSTLAAIPTSGTTSASNTSAGSSGVTVPIFETKTYQVPGATGLSFCAPSSCWLHIAWWSK